MLSNIRRVLGLCHRLERLHQDPHPGLTTWDDACAQCVEELRSELVPLDVAALRAKVTALESKCEGLGERSTQETCCDPRFVERDSKGDPVRWTITLDEYQRSNLLWLLCDIAGYDRKEAIVPHLQTGDWAGEIPNALRCHEHDFRFEESARPPNVSVAQSRQWIERELAAKVAEVRQQTLREVLELVGRPGLGISAATYHSSVHKRLADLLDEAGSVDGGGVR